MWNLEIFRQIFGPDAPGEPYNYPQMPQQVITNAWIRTALTAGAVFAVGKVLKLW